MDFTRLEKVTWYPGHMRKAERELRERLSAVDLVIDLVDARAPRTTHSYRLSELVEHKARVQVLGKADLADETATRAWRDALHEEGVACFSIHHRQRQQMPQLIDLLLKTAHDDPRSRWGRLAYKRAMRAMVIGLPNVGKSTLINSLAGGKRARIGPEPGVTRSQQWVLLGKQVELLDTPGIMFPNIADPRTGLKLGLLAMLKHDIVSDEVLTEYLLYLLRQQERHDALARYGIESLPATVHELLDRVGAWYGCLLPGGGIDQPLAATHIVRDFREGKLSRLSLELPGDE